MSTINTLPLGLLEYLFAKADGTNPRELRGQVLGTLDLERYYSASMPWQTVEFAAIDPATLGTRTQPFTSYASEFLALVKSLTVFSGYGGVGANVRARAAIVRNPATNPTVAVLGEAAPVNTTVATNQPSSRLLAPSDPPFLVRFGAGYAPGFYLDQCTFTAGLEPVTGVMEFVNLSRI